MTEACPECGEPADVEYYPVPGLQMLMCDNNHEWEPQP